MSSSTISTLRSFYNCTDRTTRFSFEIHFILVVVVMEVVDLHQFEFLMDLNEVILSSNIKGRNIHINGNRQKRPGM